MLACFNICMYVVRVYAGQYAVCLVVSVHVWSVAHLCLCPSSLPDYSRISYSVVYVQLAFWSRSLQLSESSFSECIQLLLPYCIPLSTGTALVTVHFVRGCSAALVTIAQLLSLLCNLSDCCAIPVACCSCGLAVTSSRVVCSMSVAKEGRGGSGCSASMVSLCRPETGDGFWPPSWYMHSMGCLCTLPLQCTSILHRGDSCDFCGCL